MKPRQTKWTEWYCENPNGTLFMPKYRKVFNTEQEAKMWAFGFKHLGVIAVRVDCTSKRTVLK